MAIKIKSKPQAELSKKMILESLLTLMEEKKYEKITIMDITDKAQLSRRTFYRNFDSKEDVLEMLMKILVKEYTDNYIKCNTTSLEGITEKFFKFWKRRIRILHILNNNNLMFILIEAFNKYVPIIHEYAYVSDGFSSNTNRTEAIYFMTGGFWNLLCRWLNEGAERTPEEMSKVMKEFIDSFKYFKWKKIKYNK